MEINKTNQRDLIIALAEISNAIDLFDEFFEHEGFYKYSKAEILDIKSLIDLTMRRVVRNSAFSKEMLSLLVSVIREHLSILGTEVIENDLYKDCVKTIEMIGCYDLAVDVCEEYIESH